MNTLMCQGCVLLSLELSSYSCIFRALTILVAANISSLSLSSPMWCLLAYGSLGKFLYLKIYAELLTASTPQKRRSDCYSLACADGLKCVPDFALSCNK